MDDAVLGLVWVCSVCIVMHVLQAWYFQKVLKGEASLIDNRIDEIDNGIGAIAQYIVDKFGSSDSPQAFDWGSIISQIFTEKFSPNNDYNRLSNGQFNGERQEEQQEPRTEEVESVFSE